MSNQTQSIVQNTNKAFKNKLLSNNYDLNQQINVQIDIPQQIPTYFTDLSPNLEYFYFPNPILLLQEKNKQFQCSQYSFKKEIFAKSKSQTMNQNQFINQLNIDGEFYFQQYMQHLNEQIQSQNYQQTNRFKDIRKSMGIFNQIQKQTSGKKLDNLKLNLFSINQKSSKERDKYSYQKRKPSKKIMIDRNYIQKLRNIQSKVNLSQKNLSDMPPKYTVSTCKSKSVENRLIFNYKKVVSNYQVKSNNQSDIINMKVVNKKNQTHTKKNLKDDLQIFLKSKNSIDQIKYNQLNIEAQQQNQNTNSQIQTNHKKTNQKICKTLEKIHVPQQYLTTEKYIPLKEEIRNSQQQLFENKNLKKINLTLPKLTNNQKFQENTTNQIKGKSQKSIQQIDIQQEVNDKIEQELGNQNDQSVFIQPKNINNINKCSLISFIRLRSKTNVDIGSQFNLNDIDKVYNGKVTLIDLNQQSQMKIAIKNKIDANIKKLDIKQFNIKLKKQMFRDIQHQRLFGRSIYEIINTKSSLKIISQPLNDKLQNCQSKNQQILRKKSKFGSQKESIQTIKQNELLI